MNLLRPGPVRCPVEPIDELPGSGPALQRVTVGADRTGYQGPRTAPPPRPAQPVVDFHLAASLAQSNFWLVARHEVLSSDSESSERTR